MKQPLTILCKASLALLLVGPVSAAVHYELGDAGKLPKEAQAVLSNGEPVLTEIYGKLSTDTDIDMYLIEITDPANFSAVTSGGDTQLFLFDFNGMGIASKDDDPDLFGPSKLPAGSPLYSSLMPGLYYLAICGYNHEPLSGSAQKKFIFPDSFNELNGPTGTGGSEPIIDWALTSGEIFYYSIVLTGVKGVPDSGHTLGLLALSLSGLTIGLKLRQRRLTRGS